MTHFHDYPIFTYIRSEENARTLLKSVYLQQTEVDAEIESYQNAASFMYAFSSGIDFFEQGTDAPILTQPLLYFYACAHVIKGLLICQDPSYPSSTKQLAHGLSSRKKKKKHYTFLQDEIRVQRNGLFPVAASSLFQLNVEANTSYSMHHLLALIPEMQPIFSFRGKRYLEHIGYKQQPVLSFSEELLSHYHLPIEGFIKKITPYIPSITHREWTNNKHIVHLQTPVTNQVHPFFIEQHTEKLYIPNRRAFFSTLDELLIHYMILYNLSMITRYEMEWWGEVIATKATTDFPFIQHFLHVTAKKLPTIIHSLLAHILKGSITNH